MMPHVKYGIRSLTSVPENLPFVIPQAEIVAAYERLGAPLDQQIFNLELESRDLATLRDTLLPKLLSGGVSVKKVEEAAYE